MQNNLTKMASQHYGGIGFLRLFFHFACTCFRGGRDGKKYDKNGAQVSDEITPDKNAGPATDISVSSSLSERISKLEQKRHRSNATAPQARIPRGGMALAGRVSSELVAGLVVGAGSGWVLDRWLDCSPLMLVVMFFVGAAAGMLNVWRALSGCGMAAGYFEDYKTRSDKDRTE